MTREQEAMAIQQVLDGDVNAFEPIVKEYEKNVYNLALKMTGNPEDAADISQELLNCTLAQAFRPASRA